MAQARKRRKRVVSHQVNVSLQAFDISRAGTSLDLVIYHGEEKLGELTLGKGSINWRGRNRQKWKRLRWIRFAELMDEFAYGDRR
ncbi:MAG TPA: hypothetical protein VK933_10310 [Longimicrobiales bacterium]|nr:hypothetical protein [Longimicrobiales bacterium]